MLRVSITRDSTTHLDMRATISLAGGLAIIRAATNDDSKSYLVETRKLVRAEVFSDLLEQSEHLLGQGYYQAAAVLAGGVLEDSLRRLCHRKGIGISVTPKLDGMNADLTKKGVYSVLVKKRITWLADLRNKPANGLWSEFNKADVERMLPEIRNFVTDSGTI